MGNFKPKKKKLKGQTHFFYFFNEYYIKHKSNCSQFIFCDCAIIVCWLYCVVFCIDFWWRDIILCIRIMLCNIQVTKCITLFLGMGSRPSSGRKTLRRKRPRPVDSRDRDETVRRLPILSGDGRIWRKRDPRVLFRWTKTGRRDYFCWSPTRYPWRFHMVLLFFKCIEDRYQCTVTLCPYWKESL